SSSRSDSKEHRVIERPQSGPPQSNPDELADGISRWIEASTSFFYVEIFSIVLVISCCVKWNRDWSRLIPDNLNDSLYEFDYTDYLDEAWSEAWNEAWAALLTPIVYLKYALSVGAVSLGICVILQTSEFLFPGVLAKVVVPEREDGRGGHTVEKISSVFLLLWWTVGTGIITFRGPFVDTSNGWIAAWGGFFATLHWCLGIDTSTFHDLSEGRRYLKFLQFWSVVLVFASITPLRYKPMGYEGAGFAIAAGVLSLVACMYMISFYNELSREVMRMTSMLLFLLWVCVAGVCTFYGPFLVPNNGYFACWTGCFCAFKLWIIQWTSSERE
ncbi:hypothetical protein ACHAWX_000221, partial [Stephanocyclus meneghinianus]